MGDPSLYESKEYRYYTWYGDSYGPVWLSEISCHGNESNLSQCKVDNPVDVLCSYANGVLEVMCRPRNYTARKFLLLFFLFCFVFNETRRTNIEYFQIIGAIRNLLYTTKVRKFCIKPKSARVK